MAFGGEQQNFTSHEESSEADSLRSNLRALFQAQSDKVMTLRDYNDSTRPTEKFLGGKIEFSQPGHFINVAVCSWSVTDGYENVTISLDDQQYLITGYGVTKEGTQGEHLDDATMIFLQGVISPDGRAKWSQAQSRNLARQQEDLYEMLDRKV